MLTVPGLCWLCRMPLALSHWGICSVCARAVRQRVSVCPQCGLPARHPSLPCGRCLQKPPPWQRLVSVSNYTPPLSLLVHQLKFTRRNEIAAALARLLLQEVLMARRSTGLQLPDRIVSVPLWSRRHWRRGFNQSDLVSALAGLRVGQPDHHAGTGDRNTTSSQRQVTETQFEKRVSP